MKWIEKSEGAISIFLCIIMTALIILSGLLVDGSRIRTGQTQVQQAVNSASNSALTGYNKILKDVYGIFALAHGDEESLNQEIESYLNKTLMTELGLNEADIDSDTFAYLKDIFTGDGKKMSVNFLNLYDYRVENVSTVPMYNLSETKVLEGQLIDYMKYRAPKELLVDGFIDKLKNFGSISKQSAAMEKKIETDKKLGGIRKLQEKLTLEINEINKLSEEDIQLKYDEYINQVDTMLGLMESYVINKGQLVRIKAKLDFLYQKISDVMSSIIAAQKAEQDTAALNNTLTNLQSSYSEAQEQYSKLTAENAKLDKEINGIKVSSDKLISSLRTELVVFQEHNENAAKYIGDILKKSDEALIKIGELESTLKGDKTDFSDKMSDEAKVLKEELDPAKLKQLQAELQSNSRLLKNYINIIDEFRPDKINVSQMEAAVSAGVTGNDAIVRKILNKELKYWSEIKNDYKKVENFSGVNPVNSSNTGTDMREKARSWTTGNENPMTEDEKVANSEDTENDKLFNKKQLPSYKEGQMKSRDFSAEDKEYISSYYNTVVSAEGGDGSDIIVNAVDEDIRGLIQDAEFTEDEAKGFSENAFQMISSMFASITDRLEAGRNNLYINEYAMGMFNNALTDRKLNASELEKKGERDLRDRLKSSRTAYFDNSEIEYILAGMKSSSANRASVKGQILLIRFAMNSMHVYMDAAKNRQALAAATAIAGWTGFGVPVVHSLIMLSWAMAEAVLDVKSLIEGKKVPLMKSADSWCLSIDGGIRNTVDGVIDFAVDKAEDIGKKAIERLDEIANEKIAIAVDKIFSPVEVAVEKGENVLTHGFEAGEDFLEQKLEDQGNSSMNELQIKIYEEVERIFKSKSSEIENILKEQSSDKAREIISGIKQNIADETRNGIKAVKDKINQEIEKTARVGRDKLRDFLDQLEGNEGQSKTTSRNSIKSNLFSLSYQDYLKVFLFIKDDAVKVGRIGDLIQLNIGKQINNSDFRLAECNTYIRVDAIVSVKYLFMTQYFMPKLQNNSEGSRHNIRTVLYQGY